MSNQTALLAKKKALLLKEQCRRSPLYWIANYVKTEKTGKNRQEDETAIQPFPVSLPYVEPFVETWRANNILHIAKSRQMSVSWLCQIMLVWEAQFKDHTLNIIINKAKKDSEDGVRRCKVIYENQPEWLKTLCPLKKPLRDMPRDTLEFANGSAIVGLPQGASQIRGLVPSTALLDEAVYQDELESTYAACVPCCSRVVTVSSAGPGPFKRFCTE